MPKILVLDEVTINQIAAGEVVERPASVVKELVENSIDAGAKRIEVHLLNGGRQKIQVVDDGSGMERADALLALERHATSKIRGFVDLMTCSSLGFRGEALSSIAAVSRTTLQTTTSAGTPGTKIVVEGGVLRSTETVGIPRGTNICVEDLFFNTPARFKFMRSIPSEVGSIKEIVMSMALGYPEISFRLTHQNMELVHTLGTGESFACLEQLFNQAICEELFPIEGSYGPLRISGFLGRPNIARGNRGQQYFFLNRRFFRSRLIAAAAQKAYDTLLPVARFPFVILLLELPLTLVDINVHPTKMEVKFKEEKEVFRGVLQVMRNGLQTNVIKTSWIPHYEPAAVNKATTRRSPDSLRPIIREEAAGEEVFALKKAELKTPEYELALRPVEGDGASDQACPTGAQQESSGEEESTTGVFTLFDTYLLWEDASALVLVDQHAAHERIIYDQLVTNTHLRMQYFLAPLTLELSGEQGRTAQEQRALLLELGWEFEEFGGDALLLRSGPQDFSVEDIQGLFLSLLDELALAERDHESNPKERMLKIMACRQAVKAGERLSARETDTLIKNLRATRIPQTCPHGRPTMVAISKAEIEKMFKRR